MRRVAAGFAAAFALTVVAALVLGWHAFGHRAVGPRRTRMEHSPEWSAEAGHFVNPEPLANDMPLAFRGALSASPDTSPKSTVPTVATDPRMLATPPASGLRVTWFGHSSTLVEIDGLRVLTDPVWSARVSPYSFVGPVPWFPPPIALGDLPHIDVVVVSHDHFDHLDAYTIGEMKTWNTTFIVPLGVGAHLAYWGVPEARIVELEWWEHTRIKGATDSLEIVMVPARHAAGRMVVDNDAKLWAGYALLGSVHRVYYSGDTGLFPAMRRIGEELGPFDLTMIEVGQYHQAWPDWHIGPEQAVRAHQIVRGKVMLPVHWAKLALAYHAWTEPIERALAEGHARNVILVAPKPGQSFDPTAPPPVEPWWPTLPTKTGAQDPVRSTQLGDLAP